MSKSSKKDRKHPNLECLTNYKQSGNASKKRSSPAEVPILIYGDDNNFPQFQQVISIVDLKKWRNSARFLTTG
jgi:hypothetical protein